MSCALNQVHEIQVLYVDKTVTFRFCYLRHQTIHSNVLQVSVTYILVSASKRNKILGFPGGAVVKNPPANSGDTGSSPGPGRSHMPWSSKACAPQLLGLRSRAQESQLLKPTHLEPVLCNKRSHRNEKPTRRN